jgi:hypothetical protein
MAFKEIVILLRAKNVMTAGLKKAESSLSGFAQSAVRVGAFFIKGFLAAGAAVAGFAAKAIAAYAQQETAERALAAALNSQGEAGDALLPSLKRISAAIQDETGAADESTLAGMAKMRMLGVQTSKLGDAAKAVIALKGVGLEEEAAQKAVAMAMQGSYDMLNRYVPALRTATSESEKAQIVNELFAKGYEQQAELLDTVGGLWDLLKGRIGDAWEEIGNVIMQNDELRSSLKRAGEAVKEFGNKVAEWAEGGGVIRLIAGFKLFYNEASHIFKLIGNTASITWAAMSDGVDTVINNIIGGFKYAADYAEAAWKKIRHPFSEFKAPNKSDYEFGVVTKQTEKALAAREKINEDYSERNKEIAADESKALIKHVEKVAEKKAQAAEAEKKLAESVTDTVVKESKKQAQARTAGLKKDLSEINRKKDLWKDLAKQRVQSVIDEAREQKEVAKEKAKEDARAQELIGREDRGTKLSKKDKEFLDAWKKIDAAKSIYKKLSGEKQTIEGQIQMAEDTLKAQQESRDYLKNISESLDDNLQYSE